MSARSAALYEARLRRLFAALPPADHAGLTTGEVYRRFNEWSPSTAHGYVMALVARGEAEIVGPLGARLYRQARR